MKKKYRELLEKTYELEGLLLLALENKDNNLPLGLAELIETKRKALVDENPDPVAEEAPESGVIATEELVNDVSEDENATYEKESVAEEDGEENKTDSEAYVINETDDEFDYDEEAVDEDDPDEEEKESSASETEEDIYHYYNLEDDEEDHPVKAFSFNKKSSSTPRRKKPVFSLNDRFLFMRELFDGDASAFNTALNKIASFNNYKEAEEYLTGACELNPEDGTAADFLAIIEKYFNTLN